MNKLLIVDDEINIRKVIREYAQFNDFEVDEAVDGLQAIEKVKEKEYDVVVMDIMMPQLDGYTACKEIREFSLVPIILLSARGTENDKLFGFELGIDDYVTKPFSPKELMARINAVVARHKVTSVRISESEANSNLSRLKQGEVFKFDGVVLDNNEKELKVDGVIVDCTPKEYDLLYYLIKNANQPLSRENLLEAVWGSGFLGDDRTVDTHIKNLRNHLGTYRDRIITLRGIGYQFEY